MRATAYLSSCHGNPVGERLCDESWSGSPHSKGLVLLFPRDTPPEHPPPNLSAPAPPCLPTRPPPWGTSETTLHFYCVPSSDYLFRRWDLRALAIPRLCNYEENDPLWCDAAVGSYDCPCEAAGQLWGRQHDRRRVETLGLGWAGLGWAISM